MKVTCNALEVAASLADIEKEISRKLEGMVRRFTHVITMTAIDYTPIGNSINYSEFYNRRVTDPNWQSYGLQPVEGFAKGSWRVDMDGIYQLQEFYGQSSEQNAGTKALNDLSQYKIGDTIMISNMGPYIAQLEAGYSDQTRGQGIVKHTIESTMRTYQYHLDDYYLKA